MMEKLPPMISAEAEQLVLAVEVALSPTSSSADRSQAYALCERFKEESPLCAQIGFQLALSSQCSPQVRHFGLQLVVHSIMFRWTDLHPQEKIAIKESTWRLMSPSAADRVGLESSFNKDGIARLVVEMVKREWPQQWPTFLQELTELAGKEGGEFQTELVLLVLLRLTEDVVLFQTVESGRRRDLYQGLTAHMEDIFRLLSGLISMEVGAYRNHLLLSGGDRLASQLHCRLAKSVLSVFHALVEWVPIQHVMANEGQLLVQLCLLLADANLRLSATECLLQVVSRKGNAKDRKPLLILFDRAAIGSMLEAAQQAVQHSSQEEEANHTFLKRLTEVLVGLGTQLCTLLGKEPDVVRPDTFPLYLQALLALSRHQSFSINQICAALWGNLYKHDKLKTDNDLMAIIPSFLEVVSQKSLRPRSISNSYNRLDFDTDEEFINFFLRFRADLLEGVRQATLCSPQVTFDLARQWLISLLDRTPTPPQTEWEALSLFLEAVCSRAGPSVQGGVPLLERLLSYQWPNSDPFILSELLSCLSSLFLFVQLDPTRLLQPVLDRILAPLLIEADVKQKSPGIRELRRHSCSLLIKISTQCPGVLLSGLDYLRAGIDRLSPALGKMELCSLQEALMVISNQMGSIQLQSELIGHLIRPYAERWNTWGASPAFSSATDFMRLVGLIPEPGAGPEEEEVIGKNRADLSACAQFFFVVLRRCKIRDEPKPVHPAAPFLVPLLLPTFKLARVLHELWEPSARAQLPPAFAKVHDLLDSEVSNILATGGVSHLISGNTALQTESKDHDPDSPSSPERAQHFLSQLHLNVFSFLGLLGESLGRDFYAQPGLAVAVAGTACYGMEHMPDYRLRNLLRSFCRQFLSSCPVDLHGPVLAPFLVHLFPAMLQRLSGKWEAAMALTQQHQANKEEETDILEIIRDVVVRLLTRDYLDVLRGVLITNSSASTSSSQQNNTFFEDEEMGESSAVCTPNGPVTFVNELGKAVLLDPGLSGYLIQFLCSALWWPDTTNSSKACTLFIPIIKHWSGLSPGSPGFPDVETVTLCLTHILNGLRILGQHEGNLNSLLHIGVQLYDTFLPFYQDALSAVLIQYAGTLREDTDLYLKKATSMNGAGMNKQNQKLDKVKRELFRKMTSQVVGQHLADLFRKPVVLASLPKMGSLRPKPKPDVVVEADLNALFIQE